MENKISISGKQTKIGSSLQDYARKILTLTLKKYFDDFVSSSILFSKDTFNFKCEISIHLESSIFVKSNSLSNDAYGAFNLANEKIKKRIRRYHRKLIDHRANNSKKIKNLQANEYIIKDSEKFKETSLHEDPVIIAESEELIKTLSVSEAIMLMNLNDQNAIFFKNINNKRLNILFRRPDGNIGWLDPKK
jgi:ribosomal subunit interface protein|tara:strand:+ start:3918 stop:4490 length:573 start_codon:yes stop_codon:yes gene_type:complete